MSGAGSGGGGGSSGTIDYPQYMKDRHSALYDWMREEVWKAQTNNPYDYLQAWSPISTVRQMEGTIDCWDDIVRGFDPVAVWESLMGQVPDVVFGLLDNPALEEWFEAERAQQCQVLQNEILPKFRRGMQDIGAVMTSAFYIGEGLLWAKAMEDGSKAEKEYKGKLAVAAFEYVFRNTSDLLNIALQKINFHKEIAHYNLESLRMAYTMMKEYTDSKNIYDIERVKWPLEMYKYLMDALGSISASAGTSYTTSASGTSRVASGVGGALAGAGMGAMAGAAHGSIGGPAGAAIGGAIGLVSGLLG